MSAPLVPVIVRVALPAEVLPVVVIVKVEFTPGAIEVGLNEAVAPAGSPLAVRLTKPEKPFRAATLTV